MKILVIGSGLIGLTTAYFLKQRGHEVTVIDRRDGPARETSFANGALLTPSMPEPSRSRNEGLPRHREPVPGMPSPEVQGSRGPPWFAYGR
jgi:glycine/D-amino acid oxidase-like deaminating enzyme